MTNREYAQTLNTTDMAQWIFERSLHWTGVDVLTSWLDTERTEL